MEDIAEIYIQLLEDEEGTYRPTKGVKVGEGIYKVLPIDDYDTVEEVWEFVPGTYVRCEKAMYEGKAYLKAVEQVEGPNA